MAAEISSSARHPDFKQLVFGRWRLWLIGAVVTFVPAMPDIVQSFRLHPDQNMPLLSSITGMLFISLVNFIDADIALRKAGTDRLTFIVNLVLAFGVAFVSLLFLVASWIPDFKIFGVVSLGFETGSASMLALLTIGVAFCVSGEVWLATRFPKGD